MKIAIIFGGAGYIGTFLLKGLHEAGIFDRYIIADIKKPRRDFPSDKVSYLEMDVRKPIDINIGNVDVEGSWIYNFAAVHREPGHDYNEYFDTNIPGAENINQFALKSGIRNMLFTSSIAPYGRSLHPRTERSALYPETAYGISKSLAEKIHQQWLAGDENRRLIIVRPSVIFGPEDPGNIFRMIKAVRKGTFILPNGGKVIKAYGYIFGLVESMLFTMRKSDRLIIYNYAENPLVPLNEMVEIVKKTFGYKKMTLKLPVPVLVILAAGIQLIFKITGRKSDIHPVRVRKAGFPTNIQPKYLIENDFNFKYDFENALHHWRSECPNDFE